MSRPYKSYLCVHYASHSLSHLGSLEPKADQSKPGPRAVKIQIIREGCLRHTITMLRGFKYFYRKHHIWVSGPDSFRKFVYLMETKNFGFLAIAHVFWVKYGTLHRNDIFQIQLEGIIAPKKWVRTELRKSKQGYFYNQLQKPTRLKRAIESPTKLSAPTKSVHRTVTESAAEIMSPLREVTPFIRRSQLIISTIIFYINSVVVNLFHTESQYILFIHHVSWVSAWV